MEYGDKIYKLLQKLERNVNVADLHSFIARIRGGSVEVEARQGEVFIGEQRDTGDYHKWVGSYIAAANRLEMLGLDLESVEI